MADDTGGRLVRFDHLGEAVAYVRQSQFLSQADLADLVASQGLDWRREQVVRVEAGQRQVTAHELLVVAHTLRHPLWILYQLAGYPQALVASARAQNGSDVPVPEWDGAVQARLSPAARAYVRGDHDALLHVQAVVGHWRRYETSSGRPPSERAERAKRASLWREYDEDPEGFTARAFGGQEGQQQ